MEFFCSFKSFASGTCGFSYREDRSCISQVVPLCSCQKDISSHLQSCKFQLFCRVPASSRRQKISMILQFTPLIDEISVLGGVVIPVVDIERLKKCPVIVKAGLSRFRKQIEGLASVYHRCTQDV